MIRILLARKITINHCWSRSTVTTSMWRLFLALAPFSTLISCFCLSAHIPATSHFLPGPEHARLPQIFGSLYMLLSYLERPSLFPSGKLLFTQQSPSLTLLSLARFPHLYGEVGYPFLSAPLRFHTYLLFPLSKTLKCWSPHWTVNFLRLISLFNNPGWLTIYISINKICGLFILSKA